MKTRIFSLAIGALLMVFASCSKTPTASIKASMQTAEVGESISFSNSSTEALTYEWDFGDGTTSTSESPSKIYTEAGNYLVKMTAYSKKEKKKDVASLLITVVEKENANQKFEGTYLVGTRTGNLEFTCAGAGEDVTIVAVGKTGIILSVRGTTYNATVSGTTFTITPMTESSTGWGGTYTYEINGSGSLAGSVLTFTIEESMTDSANPNNSYTEICKNVATKKTNS